MAAPNYHFRLFQDLGKIVAAYNESRSDALLPKARALRDECKLALTAKLSLVAPHQRVLLSTALAQLLLKVPVACDDERLGDVIAICAPWIEDSAADADESVTAIISQMRAVGHALIGQAYLQYRNGSRNENHQFARRHLERALEMFRPSTSAQLVCATHHNLGAACTRLLDFASAIHHCEIASEGFPRDLDPTRWAVIQSDLGLAELSGDGRRTESAMSHILRSLEVFDPRVTPRLWAHAQCRLAMAFLYRSVGDRQQNLDAAIECCRRALTVFSTEAFADARASALLTLARSAYKSTGPDREHKLSEVIDALTEARELKGADRGTEAARIRLLLAQAYFARRRGVEDLRSAVEYYQEALALLPREKQASRAIAARELQTAQSLLAAAPA